MSIQMIRGYVGPPADAGAAYHEFSQFGYTHITQEGTGETDYHEEAFTPIEHWNGYDGSNHPMIDTRRPAGLMVPGPLGGCSGGCCQGGNSGYGDLSLSSVSPLMLAVGALAAYLLLKKPSPGFGRYARRRRHSGKKVKKVRR